MNVYHVPAMLESVIEGLEIKPDGIYVDLTFGGGGHSREILKRLNENGKLIVFDRDDDALKNKFEDKRMIFVKHNFRFIYQFLRCLGIIPVDGILADLGVSSHQFDVPERGFSFRFDGDLDMRMNQNSSKTAMKILNSYTEEQLTKIFKIYGEIPSAGRLAHEIVIFRANQSISTTKELKEIASKLAPYKDSARFFSQVFQSLRIEVNNELDDLKEMLNSSEKVLKKGGRLAIISYHSLEDRMVKNFFRSGDVNVSETKTDIFGKITTSFKPVVRKPIMPSAQEIEKNPRIRSAKLRICEKI